MATPAKPAPDNNEVSLQIAGKAHRYWTQYSIDSDLAMAADAWQVSLGLPGGEMPPSVAPGAEVKVLVGADIVLQGRVDDISHSVGAGSHQLTLSGRDLAGMLLDCSAPLFTGKGMTLSDVLENVVKPLGVSRVRVIPSGVKMRRSRKRPRVSPVSRSTISPSSTKLVLL